MRYLFLLPLLIVVSCATSYQPRGMTGGYEDTQLGEHLWRVTVNGNGYTSSSVVRDYALLRASELTLEKGYKYFYVSSDNNAQQNSVATVGGNSSRTTGNIDSFGNFNANTYYSTPTNIPITKFGNELVFVMLNKKSDIYFVYDAQFIYDSLSAKYIK